MNKAQLQQQIIGTLWSKDLKKYVTENNYSFSESELLYIAYSFPRNHDERLQLLQLLEEHASQETAALATKCIRFLSKCFKKFCQHTGNEVYELRIKETPKSYEERYLCADHRTALDMIDKFYRHYDFTSENETTRYVIAKRTVYQPTDDFRDDYEDDSWQECIYGPGKVLLSVSTWGHRGNPERNMEEVLFPDFVPHLSPVRYLSNGQILRGVNLSIDGLPSETCYIIPFDGEMLQSRDHEKYWDNHWHMHIPGPEVEILSPDELTDQERDDYDAFVEFWNKTGIHVEWIK